MDLDVEKMQSLGFFGIIRESFNLLVRNARLMASIALLLVLPPSFTQLGHTLLLYSKILAIQDAIDTHQQLNFDVASELNYFVYIIAFSFLSTAAVAYSVACLYMDRSVVVANILRVVLRVWKRLLVTFLWVLLAMFAYGLAFSFSISVLVLLQGQVPALLFPLLLLLLVLAFFVGFVYLNVVWQLTSVIAVLEEHYGVAALRKSARLVRGKRMIGFGLVLTSMLASGITLGVFWQTMVEAWKISWSAMVFVMLLFGLAVNPVRILVSILVQTVFYFSAKSFHHESIDLVLLSDAYELKEPMMKA